MASRLDITKIFCDLDDFYLQGSQLWREQKQLPSMKDEKRCPKGYRYAYNSRMSLSEVMTIVIAFHGSGFRTFKQFYTLQVLPHWNNAFPNLVSYNRFVELMPSICNFPLVTSSCFIRNMALQFYS